MRERIKPSRSKKRGILAFSLKDVRRKGRKAREGLEGRLVDSSAWVADGHRHHLPRSWDSTFSSTSWPGLLRSG